MGTEAVSLTCSADGNPSFLLGWNTEKTGTRFSNSMNERLRLISGREQLILTPTDGNDTLARATDVFSYIDSNFKHWACEVEGQWTEETPVLVYEMVENITLHKMFDGFEVEADHLSLTQSQIKQFV